MSAPPDAECSFCQKKVGEPVSDFRPEPTVRYIIEGPKVFICDACVSLCGEILIERGIKTMDIKQLQEAVNDRWALQAGNPCHGTSDATHALVHLTKALGKVATAINDAEHEQRELRPGEVDKYLADLVICAARCGHGVVDLGAACADRLAEKFPVTP